MAEPPSSVNAEASEEDLVFSTKVRSSRTHMLVCECWGPGLIVWEVAQCYKTNLMMRRAKEEVTGWEVSDPPHVGICWSNDGQLYAIDKDANLYSVLSDGINMVTNLDWSDNLKGDHNPCVCSFGNGILIYGPDPLLRSLKKCESQWKVAWTYQPPDTVLRLISNSNSTVAVMWTESGMVYKITGESEEKIDVELFTFKQRHIQRIQLIAPDYTNIATMSKHGVLCIYEVLSAKLISMKYVQGNDVSFQASPVDPLLIIFGEVGPNYGMVLMTYDQEEGLQKVNNMCLTHQIVSQVVFSPSGREIVAAAMSAGHIFIMKLSQDYKLHLVRYMEIGRGLADCFLMRVGEAMRCFALGPYARLLPLRPKDTMVGIPHLSRQYHVLKLSGDKGITVAVKMGPIIESGHDVKYFDGFFNLEAFLTYGYDGTVVLREPDGREEYELKLVVTHRYESGIRQAVIDSHNKYIAHQAGNHTVAVQYLNSKRPELKADPKHETPDLKFFDESLHRLNIIGMKDKNYLDLQEDKKVHEEAMDYKRQREDVVAAFVAARAQLVELLEENLAERPLHQLSLSEFNLHMEHRKERLKQAEQERADIRVQTEARIRAQDKVTAWIQRYCWDSMLTPRVKLFAIFSYYQVENYPVLPTQRDSWPELKQVEALRTLEMENDEDLFRPEGTESTMSLKEATRKSAESQMASELVEPEEAPAGEPYVLSGTVAHKFLNVQNMRLWFNKQFDELMALKKREVGLVCERNARLRFIIEELNKLSDLRGSFHHLVIPIKDPEWRQEEQPQRLIKVDPEECSISPYISPSQIVIIPPEGGPKDDFRERALMEMMDGVLEKLWHEEIKKPIMMPQCMLEKDPEHFNEEDLRHVFDYEAKVKFRNEERDKYRKMLHAEYAKLSLTLNEGVVKFNQRVDSVIGQETLNLMRLRRTNLDREQGEEVQAAYDALALKDKYLDRTFKNHFADLSPIIVDQCYKFFNNMPPVMDEGLWATMVRLRRVKIENEIRLVLPSGQVEITTSGHIEDYEDATLILREDIEKINEVILKVGDMKLRMMRKQMEFRKGILAKEWEHAQMMMKLRHMAQELATYRRLKLYLKNKELGYTDEQDYLRLEKEMEASKQAVNKVLTEQIQRVEELELKIAALEAKSNGLEKLMLELNVKVSEKRLHEDPLEPIRVRRLLVTRSMLIREVQQNHSTIVMLQTELELLRLKTYPTLASFRTIS
ncbi:hypothetical protein MSG28_002530 [Choristoneura fumiferana]|uniref:Uncharacterized protein n=1 Tax=Choristoneura fumiferana TaxID=7141 RepID=A0ACC0JWH8_CHOFU|nr:hypothetical protein MSG28_002530 [Choristoneura fumiferana]